MKKSTSPQQFLLQALGFALGAWLLWTVVQNALQTGDFTALHDAEPMKLGLMLLLSLASSVCNAALFTSVSRPLAPNTSLSLRRMIPLNFSCGALNYAPFRLGTVARVAWHVRVDGMNTSRVSALMAMAGGWYLLIGLAAFGALWIRPAADWGTLCIALAFIPLSRYNSALAVWPCGHSSISISFFLTQASNLSNAISG